MNISTNLSQNDIIMWPCVQAKLVFLKYIICFLIAHHHTYTNVQGEDYQILIEADFLVNLYEEDASEDAIKTALKNIFHTDTGTKICKAMFKV